MADVRFPSMDNQQHMSAYGNEGNMAFRLSTAAFTNGDVMLVGVIPAGARIVNFEMANTASTGATTLKCGFRNQDGSVTSPDDGGATFQIPADDYFLAATAISAAARTRWAAPGTVANGKGLALRLNKPIIIIATLGGATIATSTFIDIFVDYKVEGVK